MADVLRGRFTLGQNGLSVISAEARAETRGRPRKTLPVSLNEQLGEIHHHDKAYVAEVIRWLAVNPKDDTVMVYDSNGEQVPGLQGSYTDHDLIERIKEKDELRTVYKLGWWCSRVFRTVSRSQWLDGVRE